jgi:hypothetical protein
MQAQQRDRVGRIISLHLQHECWSLHGSCSSTGGVLAAACMAAAQLRLHELLAAFCNADGSLSNFDTMFRGVINLAKLVVHWGLSAGRSWREL